MPTFVDAAFATLFTVDGYPGSERWKEQARLIENDYYVVPLPAFDINGTVIQPQDYDKVLTGAIVHATVAFVCYCISGKKKVLVAEIQELRVLKAAPKVPTNRGNKRKLALIRDAVVKKSRSSDTY